MNPNAASTPRGGKNLSYINHPDLVSFVDQFSESQILAPTDQAKKNSSTEVVVDSVKTYFKDLSYSRLCCEKKIYLNKSNTKWLMFGLRPTMGSDFTKEIRLCTGSYYITLERYHLTQLLDSIKSIPQITKPATLYPDTYSYNFEEVFVEPLKIERGPFNDTVLQITDGKGVKIYLGLISLQHLVDIEKIMFTIFDSLNAPLYAKVYNECLVEALNYQTDEKFFEETVKQHLLKICHTEWPNRDIVMELTLHYLDFILKHAFKVKFNKN